jgi:CDP-glucose 4,6-dehydratase
VKELTNRDILTSLKGPILITGHTGFKGTWLTLLLERVGIEVAGFSLKPTQESLYSKMNRDGVIRECFGDIRNLGELAKFTEEVKPTFIIHLAAQSLVRRGFDEPMLTFETNAMGTANVLQVGTKSSTVQAIAAITTDKVYRNDNSYQIFDESAPLGGHDPYSASKVASEAAIMAWRSLSTSQSDKPIYSLRAGNVIGGGDFNKDRLFTDLINSAKNNQPLKLRNINATRPWQHALDPLTGYLRALVLAPNVTDFNFGPLEPSLRVEEAVKIAQAFGRLHFVYEVESQTDTSKIEAQKLELDSTAAIDKLGWRQSWNQHQAIQATMEWWEATLLNGFSMTEACDKDLARILEQ